MALPDLHGQKEPVPKKGRTGNEERYRVLSGRALELSLKTRDTINEGRGLLPRTEFHDRFTCTVRQQCLDKRLHFTQADRAMAAATMLIDAERRGQLDLSETREMLDFGTGFGGPTLALVELAILNGGNVTGVDEKDNITGSLSDEKILDGDHYIIGDGLKVLENAASGYDLITAFMLGPDIDGQLSIKLIDLSRQSLKPKGKLLITSDHITIDFVTRACRYLNIDYRQVSPRYEGEVFSQGYIIITAAQKEEELEAAA